MVLVKERGGCDDGPGLREGCDVDEILERTYIVVHGFFGGKQRLSVLFFIQPSLMPTPYFKCTTTNPQDNVELEASRFNE